MPAQLGTLRGVLALVVFLIAAVALALTLFGTAVAPPAWLVFVLFALVAVALMA